MCLGKVKLVSVVVQCDPFACFGTGGERERSLPNKCMGFGGRGGETNRRRTLVEVYDGGVERSHLKGWRSGDISPVELEGRFLPKLEEWRDPCRSRSGLWWKNGEMEEFN